MTEGCSPCSACGASAESSRDTVRILLPPRAARCSELAVQGPSFLVPAEGWGGLRALPVQLYFCNIKRGVHMCCY